jgi:xyloglucan-specific endo-beta-1,4-glucanase
VKAFPAAILGWDSLRGWQVASQKLLPRTISSLVSTQCSWTYSVTGGALQAISFDIFVHNTTCKEASIGTSSLPSDEVMIWLHTSGGIQPMGSQSQTDLVLDNASWTLWEGTDGSRKVHSFVRQGNVTSVDHLEIKAFLDKLDLGSKCLTSIQAGTEVFQGTGTVKTSSYSCEVN